MARVRDGEGVKGRHAPMRPRPCAEEESWNTLAVTGGRGEAWSTAHRRLNSENARPRARCRASPMPRSNKGALGHPRRWRHHRRSARSNCWRAGGSSPMNLRPNDGLERTRVMKIDDEKKRGRPSPRHQALAWWKRRSPREQTNST